MFFISYSLVGPYKTRTHLSYTISGLYRCWGRFLTSVKGNGQAREQLFSKWISVRLIDTGKETLIGF
jgi:hypothetical protein